MSDTHTRYVHGKMYNLSKNSSVEEDDDADCCEARTKLECCLIVLVVAAAVGISLQVFLLHSDYTGSVTPCVDSECVRQAAWMLESINPQINPCQDFYRFICGKFTTRTTKNGMLPPIQELQALVKHQIDSIIAEPVTDEDTNSVKAQKSLFKACVNQTELTAHDSNVLLAILEELGGWPILEPYLRSYNNFDWKQLIGKARNMGLKYDIFLSFSIYENYMDTEINMLEIKVPPKIDRDEKFSERLINVAQRFKNTTLSVSDPDVKQIINFHNTFIKVLDNYEQYAGKFKRNISSGKISIKQLQSLYFYMPWLDIINDVTSPAYNFSSDDEIIFEANGYIDVLHVILGGTNRRTILNYVIWRILEDLIPYIDANLQNEWKSNISVNNIHKEKVSRHRFCTTFAKSILPYGVQIGYLQKYKITAETKSQIQDMFENIKHSLIQIIQSVNWMDNIAKQAAVEHLANVAYYIGAPNVMTDEIYFEKLLQYDKLNLNYTGFLEMVLEVRKNRHDYAASHLGKTATMLSLCPFCAEVTSVNAFYSLQDNTIMLPAALLQNPVFQPDAPKYLNYGLLGSIIGHEITHSFNKFVREFENGSVVSLETVYREKLQCFADQYDNYFYDDVPYSVNAGSAAYETIADYTGVKLAYLAYRHWTYQNHTEKQLPGLAYSPEQLFWMSTVFRNCNSSAKDVLIDDSYAVRSFRATAPLRNSPYFNYDFQCKDKTFMNLKNKCDNVL